MNNETTPYRTATPLEGDSSEGFASGGSGFVPCIRTGASPSSAAVVTLSTLVALLAMAVVFDTAGGRSPLRSDSYSYTLDGAKKCDESDSPIQSSLTGRLVRAARDFLGTGVPASSAWHFASSCFSIDDFTMPPCTERESLVFEVCHEVTLDHLLNIPPPTKI